MSMSERELLDATIQWFRENTDGASISAALEIVGMVRRSQSEASELRKENEQLRCDNEHLEAVAGSLLGGEELDAEAVEAKPLRERVGELQSLLSEIRAFAPERPEKGRMYLVPTSKFMYIDAALSQANAQAKQENQEGG